MKRLTPMMEQYHRIKQENPDLLLFFRLGDFYEMFFDDAVLGSKDLEITLTSRNKDSQGHPIPMCGVPHHALETYLVRLIQRGHKVAICEQVEAASQKKGIVRREVTRIVTPGTVTETDALDATKNNYIASVEKTADSYSLALIDLSSGSFTVSEFKGENSAQEFGIEINQVEPREMLFPESQESLLKELLAGAQEMLWTAHSDWTYHPDFALRTLRSHFGVLTMEGFGVHPDSLFVGCAGALLHYLSETQRSELRHVTRLDIQESSRQLRLDTTSIRNLELTERYDGSRDWTLLGVLDETRTRMGARLLRHWVLKPCYELPPILARLDAQEELLESPSRINSLREALKEIQDIERLLGRVSLNRAGPRDLLALAGSLSQLPVVNGHLTSLRSQLIQPHGDELDDMVAFLAGAISEEAPVQLGDGQAIKRGFNEELDQLRETATSGKSLIARVENSERERTGIAKLRVKYNRVFGYFIEVTKSHLASVPEDYIRKQTLVNAERFVTPELKEYEEQVLYAQDRMVALERDLFEQIRSELLIHSSRILDAAAFLAQLDTLLALARVAHRNGYIRPSLDNGSSILIEGGRHPVLEQKGEMPFTPNDLHLDNQSQQLIILTGPNMGGKSTYLRQNALIVIMAQMGSFVPAKSAQIGLVDRIYTRVGASDDLAGGQSTFMVEMVETANILNTATPKSLVLLDEVGRGTSTFDGLSIAWAIAEYMSTTEGRQARTLFATHYQELTRLELLFENVQNYCVAVKETSRGIVFLHRVLPGRANRSYGIEVARLAGLPAPVIDRARQVLSRLEKNDVSPVAPNRSVASGVVLPEPQKTLF